MCVDIEELNATGFPRNLTPQQSQSLQDFIEKLTTWKEENPEMALVEKKISASKEDRSKTVYLKFLRARQFNLEESFKLYSSFLQWKYEFQGIGVNNILISSIMNEVKTQKCFSFGHCKSGRPVTYIKVHLHKKSESDPKEAERFVAWFFESCKDLPRAYPIETSTVIIDLHTFGRDNMDLTMARTWMEMLSTRYPECLGQGFLLNAPWIFSAFWGLLKPFIDPKTFKKLQWVKSADLLNFIDQDNLLKEFGGKGEYSLEKDPMYSSYFNPPVSSES